MELKNIISNKTLGMARVSACVPSVRPADIPGNITSIKELTLRAFENGAEVAVFPELCVTGYTNADLFNDDLLLSDTVSALFDLADFTREIGTAIVIGAPLRHCNCLYNCAVVIAGGSIHGAVPKCFLPNYNEFYEKRWFVSGFRLPEDGVTISLRKKEGEYVDIPFGRKQLFNIRGARYGIEICEDLWVPDTPGTEMSLAGAEIILNLSASDALLGKRTYLLDLIKSESARCRCGYVYASAGFGESSTDLAFCGNALIAENGVILQESVPFGKDSMIEIADIDLQHLRHDRIHFNSFSDGHLPSGYKGIKVTSPVSLIQEPMAYRKVDPTPFIDSDKSRMAMRCDEISSIQAWGLATRLKAIGCRNAVIGISGGLDSTLALLVTVKAFDMSGLDRKGIHAITMPGFGTTRRTKTNADNLMELLGVTPLEINIGAAVNRHFEDIDHNPDLHDITYENSQARQRTLILMDYANKVNGIVIGTGDLSELALGWCTYNGDQMSMYGVNSSVPKTMVKYLVNGYARNSDSPELAAILDDIIATPISPELLPADENGTILQKTEDTVGPYELHDFFLYQMMRYGSDPLKIAFMANKGFGTKYDLATIYKWLRTFYKRFFSQQFKRSCMPDGVKVGSICLSPRGDWRMPSDASSRIWIDRIDKAISLTQS